MNSCNAGHELIEYHSRECPLCFQRRQVKAACEILRGAYHTYPTTEIIEQALERLDNAVERFARG